MIDVTQQYCPESGVPEGADNSTHHMVPTSGGRMVCRYCLLDRATLAMVTPPVGARTLREVWAGDFALLADALLPYMETLPDGTQIIASSAPEWFTRPYQALVQMGMVNGWFSHEPEGTTKQPPDARGRRGAAVLYSKEASQAGNQPTSDAITISGGRPGRQAQHRG